MKRKSPYDGEHVTADWRQLGYGVRSHDSASTLAERAIRQAI